MTYLCCEKGQIQRTMAVKVVPPQSKPQCTHKSGAKADAPHWGWPAAESGLCVFINKDSLAHGHTLTSGLSTAAVCYNSTAEQLQQGLYVPQSREHTINYQGIHREACQPLHEIVSALLTDKNKPPDILRAGISKETDFFSRTMKF